MSKAIALAILSLLAGACSTLRTVSPPRVMAYELSLATSGKHAVIAWHGATDTAHPDAVFLQPLDGQANPVGSPHRITDGARNAYEPDLQFLGNDAVLTWYEKDPLSGKLTAWLARTDMTGRMIWQRQLDAAGGNARNPVVRITNGAIVAAWIEGQPGREPDVWTERFAPDGLAITTPLQAGRAGHDTWNLNAAVDTRGAFYVAYDAQLGTLAKELRLLVIDLTGVRDVALSLDDGFGSVYPDLAISADGQAAITWFDERDGNNEVYLRMQPLADLIEGKFSPDQRLTRTATDSIGAYLSWNNETLAVVWCDADAGQQELYAQTFDSAGKARGPIERLTRTDTQSSIPSIRAWNRGFLIAWNEYLAADGEGIHRPIVSSEARIASFQ